MRVYQFRHVGIVLLNIYYGTALLRITTKTPVAGAHGGTRTPTPEGTWT